MRNHLPGFRHQAITPSDVTTYTDMLAIRAGGAGNLVLKDRAGTSVTYAVAAGEVLRFSAYQVMAASTATAIVAWF